VPAEAKFSGKTTTSQRKPTVQRKRHNSVRADLQVGEIVSSLEGRRLDARDFILPEVQVLQLRQLLEQAVRFDLVQFIVVQHPARGGTQADKVHGRTKLLLAHVSLFFLSFFFFLLFFLPAR